MNSQTAAQDHDYGWAEPMLLKASRTQSPCPPHTKIKQRRSRPARAHLIPMVEPFDADSAENIAPAEEYTGLLELSDAENPASPDSSPAGSATDSMAAYLEDIKILPLLSRDRECTLAQALHEAESLKRMHTAEWLLLFAELIDWRKIKTGALTHDRQPDPALLDLIGSLHAVNERLRNSGRLHNARSEAGMIRCQDAHAAAHDVNLRALYRSGTVARLKAFVRHSRTAKTGSKLLHILRQFVLHEKRSKEAKEALIRSNLRFVVSIAKHYCNRGMPLSDLIQEGNIGLIRAIDKFDYRRGYRLSTYAGWWIRQGIMRSLDNKALTIRIPVYLNGKARKIKHRQDNNGLHPDTGVAEESSGYNETVYRALQVIQEPVSLDAALPTHSRCLHESIPGTLTTFLPDRDVMGFFFAKEASKILKCLSARERSVIRLHFGLGGATAHTLEEIGARYGISRERVRQIEAAALRKMRFSADAKRLQPLLSEMAGS